MVVGHGVAGVSAGGVSGPVERGDPEQPEDEAESLGGGVVGKRRQLLLLGEHRGPEGAVVHAEYRLHVAFGVPHAFGHDETIAARFEPRGGVDPAQSAADQIEMAFVFELHLSGAVPAHAGGADLLLGGPGLAEERPKDGFEQRRLPGPVRPENTDEPGGNLQVEFVLVDPEIPEVEAGQEHGAITRPALRRPRWRRRYSRGRVAVLGPGPDR